VKDMTKDQVKAVLDRVLSWPPEAQEEAVASLEKIEEEFMGSHELSSEDREALRRSADDVQHGRFATDEKVREGTEFHCGRRAMIVRMVDLERSWIDQ
jgi:hypothetical protein